MLKMKIRLALGKVVKALVDKTHPPFRDSKLTRILCNTLGGNATTRLLVCVSPSVEHCTETISACEYVNHSFFNGFCTI